MTFHVIQTLKFVFVSNRDRTTPALNWDAWLHMRQCHGTTPVMRYNKLNLVNVSRHLVVVLSYSRDMDRRQGWIVTQRCYCHMQLAGFDATDISSSNLKHYIVSYCPQISGESHSNGQSQLVNLAYPHSSSPVRQHQFQIPGSRSETRPRRFVLPAPGLPLASLPAPTPSHATRQSSSPYR